MSGKEKPKPKFESAQEEFGRRVRELYTLADKMGRRITILVKKKHDQPATETQSRREPGEN